MSQTQRLDIEKSSPKKGSKEISRASAELVIGMVGAIGSGVSKTTLELKGILEAEYNYTVEIIQASDLIKQNSKKVGTQKTADGGAQRIIDLQEVGNKLREDYGENYLAAKAIEQIAVHRDNDNGFDESFAVPRAKSRRKATIIDSLKHPMEAILLRKVYNDIYWQFTIFAPEKVREDRLQRLRIDKKKLAGIFTRDENDIEDHGQKVSKTAFLSDFFIRNDQENDENLKNSLRRYLELIFNIGVHTPSREEAGMLAAVSAANQSACLSRQVGASIFSKHDELVSIGWNDVPKFGGGLYSANSKGKDHRCYKWKTKVCHNDEKKTDLIQQVYDSLQHSNLLSTDVELDAVADALARTPIKNLIEYSRSIHAEMEAIVSAGRSGKKGMVGGTLYTTTYPCHNCARHIVAAGVTTVYYIEPYAKSLAMNLHSDAIGVELQELNEKVLFLQYEGVGPGSMIRLFQNKQDRKSNSKLVTLEKKNALPITAPAIDGFTTHEKRVIQVLNETEAHPKAE